MWEGQSGPGRADGKHTTVTSEESCYVMHLHLQRFIIFTFFKYQVLRIVPLLHLDTFYETSAMLCMLARAKKNVELKIDSKIYFTVSILSSDFSHGTWKSRSSQKGHAWQIVLPAQFRLKWKRMNGAFITWHGL